MDVYRPHNATEEELERFHAHDYIEFLKRITPEAEHEVRSTPRVNRISSRMFEKLNPCM
jgi:acetoin utilization deacetylase AcuC-like enzyme